jgi:DMSO/TMAO reductase YedYZ molybdopterin-dependent catalytic subunit
MNLSRRDLLRLAPAAAVGVSMNGRGHAQPPDHAKADARYPGLIVRQNEPRNLETPLSELNQHLTPNEKFYVRSHFAAPPAADPTTYRLTVEGHVEKKLDLALDDLKQMEAVSREIVLECAGNSRVFLVPAVRGAQWSHGAVGNANWTGVPLGAILERAKLKAGAVDVVLIGADRGAINSDPPSPGVIHFDRGIPLAKAKADETLLVWEMNKEALPLSHGAPVRAIIGGWYGMASVKWLTRIIVTNRPHAGFWQTIDYSIWKRGAEASPQLIPVTGIEPKAIITSLGPNDVLQVGKSYTVTGLAWAGEQRVKSVELSTDGGTTWSPATLPAATALTWVRWSFELTPRAKGDLRVFVRCTDTRGRTQAEKRDPDRRTYMINHLVPVEFVVK